VGLELPCLVGLAYISIGGAAHWLGRRSLTGGLFLPCAWSMVDRWPLCR